jgi:hypothetical protein
MFFKRKGGLSFSSRKTADLEPLCSSCVRIYDKYTKKKKLVRSLQSSSFSELIPVHTEQRRVNQYENIP